MPAILRGQTDAVDLPHRITSLQLDFIHLCGIAERFSEAFQQYSGD